MVLQNCNGHMTEEEPFGWFADMEERHDSKYYDTGTGNTDDHLTGSYTSASSNSSSSPERRGSIDHKVTHSDGKYSLDACSIFSFDTLSTSSMSDYDEQCYIRITIPSCRIVQDKLGLRAEFKISMWIPGTQTREVWKRYSDFVQLARAYKIPTGYLSFFSATLPRLGNSQAIWQQLEAKKALLRDLSVGYLRWKSSKLEEFLQMLLLECAQPACHLFNFMNPL